MPKPTVLYYVTVSVKGLPPEKRYPYDGRVKGGAFTDKDAAIEFHNKMKAKGATTRFYVSDVEWQELSHANLADLS